MIRAATLIAALAALSACVPSGGAMRVSSGVEEVAVQRMRFAAEAVCLNNTTRSSQTRAAQRLDFPVTERDGNATIFINPGTLTFLRIGAAPDQAITAPDGQRTVYRGSGCSVGSPAVGVERANRVAAEILAPRLVDGSDTLSGPVGGGVNSEGGVGLFFDDLAVTLPLAVTTFFNPETQEATAFEHPVILVVHR